MSEMVERVAVAIEAVDIFSRFNDWTKDHEPGLPIEICRNSDCADEIVVIARFAAHVGEEAALELVERQLRARAAIEAMREPTAAMIMAGERAIFEAERSDRAYREKNREGYNISSKPRAGWQAMIDEALT